MQYITIFTENAVQNTDTISYHTSASGIRKNIALLRPISNEAEGRVGYGMQTRCIFRISTSARVILYLSSSKLGARHRTHKTQVVILAVQYRFLSPLLSANLIGGLAGTLDKMVKGIDI